MSFFFFKQKTAYDMRISDWSSDVCSSDLGDDLRDLFFERHAREQVGDALLDGQRRVPIGCVGHRTRDRFVLRESGRGKHAGREHRTHGCRPQNGLETTRHRLSPMYADLTAPLFRSEEHTSELQSLMRTPKS